MSHVRGAWAVVLVGCALAGCHGGHGKAKEAASEREQDSTLGASKLPGAQGVSGAMKVADSAAARRAREDSVSAAVP
jgi:hypothetical protein